MFCNFGEESLYSDRFQMEAFSELIKVLLIFSIVFETVKRLVVLFKTNMALLTYISDHSSTFYEI
jgi:hypothetical protein